MAEDYGPLGDSANHRTLDELAAGLRALPAASRDSGRVALIVRRHADGVRESLDAARLSREEGVPGDGWSRRPPRNPDAQLAVMRADVAALIANGQPLTVFGDNLFVDLDISAANLPAGTRLRAGGAVLEVTPKPHNGCHKFKGRFGGDALRFVQDRSTRPLNLRGIYWRVFEPGEVRPGDPIEVLARARSEEEAMSDTPRLPDWITDHVRRYRESNGADGHLWTPPTGGKPVPTLLLTTTGRKSKQRLTLPLIYGKTPSGYAIVASKGGAPAHPAWYRNLSADPDVEVQVGPQKFVARARTASGAERAALWKQMAEVWPPYDDYQSKTQREIPVVVLEPADA